MRIAIMQPTYFPWMGYFDLIDQVDLFVFFDHVQVVRRSWGVRNRIKSAQGEIYLSVPVAKDKNREETRYANASINYDTKWVGKHIKSIEHSYRKAPYFQEVFPDIENLIKSNYASLADLNISIITFFAKKIGIQTPFSRSSEIPSLEGKKDILLANICKAVSASEYLSPQGSAVYLEENQPGGAIVKNNIELFYHHYEHPVYQQQYGEFISHLGILDLIFNVGYSNALNLIRQGRQPSIYYKEFRKSVTVQHGEVKNKK